MSDTNTETDANQAAPVENETETRARRLGWVAKEEFKGDVEHWRSAAEFLERGERILPLLQRDNDKLHGMVSRLQGELRETKDATKELLDFTSKSEERAYTRALKELQTKAEQAAANADPATVRATLNEIDELNKSHVKPKTETKPEPRSETVDPEIQGWIEREKWYSPKNPTLYAFATETYGELERSKPGMSTADRLAETRRLAVEKFPEKFGINPKREGASSVATPSGGNAPAKRNAHSYENLPEEAKRACDKFVKTIPGYTREKYVKDYDWDN